MNILINVYDTQKQRKFEIFGDGSSFQYRMSDGVTHSPVSKKYSSYQAILNLFPIFHMRPDLVLEIEKEVNSR